MIQGVALPKDAEGREIPLFTKALYTKDGELVQVASFDYWPSYKEWHVSWFGDGLTECEDTREMLLSPPDSWDERLERENAELTAALDDWKGNAEGFQPDAYMKLPLDADGVPIRIGDVLYSSGNECRVVSITVKADGACVGVHTDEGVLLPSVNPKYLSRKNPEPLEPEPADSLERIADELEVAEGWCDKNGDYDTGLVSISEPKLREWSDRIRKLATKEDEHATN